MSQNPGDLKSIAIKYFADHPKEKDEVLRAYYAYDPEHLRSELKIAMRGHNFTNHQRWSECVWCGRSREMIRYDDLPPHCDRRPDLPEIKDLIREEETRHRDLLARGKVLIPKFIKKHGDSMETRKFLHDTHGFNNDDIEEASKAK